MMLLNCLNKTSLTPPLVTEVPVSSQESRWYWICVQGVSILLFSTIFLLDFGTVPTTGICFIQIIYAPSSSLLKGKYLPFSPSLLRLNSFHLFVILSLTQLYRYTLEIFLFSTATFKYTYRTPLRRIGQEYSVNVVWSTFQSLKRIQPHPVFAGFFICIRNSLDRPCVAMPSWSSPLKCKVSI